MAKPKEIYILCFDDIGNALDDIKDLTADGKAWSIYMIFEEDHPKFDTVYEEAMRKVGQACQNELCKGVHISSEDDKAYYWRPFFHALDGKKSPYTLAFFNPQGENYCDGFVESLECRSVFCDPDDSSSIVSKIDEGVFQDILDLIARNNIVSLCLIGRIPDVNKLAGCFSNQDSIRTLEIHIHDPTDGRALSRLKGLEHLIVSCRFDTRKERVVYLDDGLFGPLYDGFVNGNFENLKSLVFVGGSLAPPFDSRTNAITLPGMKSFYPIGLAEEQGILHTDKNSLFYASRSVLSAGLGSWVNADIPQYWKRFCHELVKSKVQYLAFANTYFDVDLATYPNENKSDDPEEIVECGDGIERAYKRRVAHSAHTPYLFKCLLETPNPALRSMFFEFPVGTTNTLSSCVAHAFVERYKCDAFYHNARSPFDWDIVFELSDKMPVPWMHSPNTVTQSEDSAIQIENDWPGGNPKVKSADFWDPLSKEIKATCDKALNGDKSSADKDVAGPSNPKRTRVK